jgi:hypothetical protein
MWLVDRGTAMVGDRAVVFLSVDGWSAGVLCSALAAKFCGSISTALLPLPPRDYIRLFVRCEQGPVRKSAARGRLLHDVILPQPLYCGSGFAFCTESVF